MKKSLLIGTLASLAILAAGYHSVNKVYAEDTQTWVPPILQGFIDKFNLNEDEVTQYVSEQREQNRAEMFSNREDRLNEAVSEGKITEEQKNLLLDKMEEHMQEREQHRKEFSSWAEENGIDLSELNMGRGGPKNGFGRGMGMH